jgi:hypothetical protein
MSVGYDVNKEFMNKRNSIYRIKRESFYFLSFIYITYTYVFAYIHYIYTYITYICILHTVYTYVYIMIFKKLLIVNNNIS